MIPETATAKTITTCDILGIFRTMTPTAMPTAMPTVIPAVIPTAIPTARPTAKKWYGTY